MSDHIEYGFIDKNNKRYKSDKEIQDNFYNKYRLQSPDQLIDSKLGVCWDQVELERACFKEMKYPFETYYLEQINKSRSTHTFLTYWYKSKLYWFEHSYFHKLGIHGPYRSRTEIFEDLHMSMNKEETDTGAIAYMLKTPKYGCTCQQYLDTVKKHKFIWEVSKDININTR